MSIMSFQVVLVIAVGLVSTGARVAPSVRHLDRINGGEVLRQVDSPQSPTYTDYCSQILSVRALDKLGGGEVLRSLKRSVDSEDKIRSLDRLGGGEVLRSLSKEMDERTLRCVLQSEEWLNHFIPSLELLLAANNPSKRSLDSLSGMAFGADKRLDSLSGGALGKAKRNFDEIDHVGFAGFVKRGLNSPFRYDKKNFDEIDRSGFNGFVKKNFDEIDRSGFHGFVKKNFDEIDRVGFHGFNKKNFDEIDRSGFHGFVKKNFDEIDRSGFAGFNKREAKVEKST